MKKIITAVALLTSIMFVSCKKDYVCNCTITRTSSSGSSSTSNDGSYTFKDSRTRAESRCNEQESTGTDAFGTYSRDCQIK